MYSEQRLLPWVEALHDALPGVPFFDAHLHVGIADPAGYLATGDEVVAALQLAGTRGLVFPLKEPEGYEAPNTAAIELASGAPALLRALARMDPAVDPLGEATRCLDAGAVGLKLHPRGDSFELSDPRLDGLFALADHERLPIMIHAGAGDEDVIPQAVQRAQEHPGARLILAHGALASLRLAAERAAELPNLFFDSSWWNPSHLWALLQLTPPGRVLMASDVPFAGPGLGALLIGRLALQAGLGDDEIAAIMGGQLQRLVDREEPLVVERRVDERGELPAELESLYVTLCATVEPMLRGEDPGQGLDLARTAADAGGPNEEVLGSVARLLEMAADPGERDALRPLRTAGFDLVLAAALVARTPAAPLP